MRPSSLRFMGCAVLSTLFMLPACDADKDLGDEGTSSEGSADDDTSDDSGGETSGDDGEITNGCGTFDTSLPGDSPIPQDPDDPEILYDCHDTNPTDPAYAYDPEVCAGNAHFHAQRAERVTLRRGLID
ncbi:MAG: hypothetical protein ACPHRO_03250 [Nannocystaceae bacterium]